jgi:hypothetical protein
VSCPPGPTADCDHDGFTVADGDCCDTPGACAQQPELVNPGAFEVLGNAIDDNCNGLLDGADLLDVAPCDTALASNSASPSTPRRRSTCAAPSTPAPAPGGVLDARWQLVNGQPLAYPNGKSIRGGFGSAWTPLRGARLLVISSGLAADATQLNPGPNGGPAVTQSEQQGSVASLAMSCPGGTCLNDWFSAANPPVKSALQLPESPVCNAGPVSDPATANDSVMLVLRLRAPTNARAFSLSAAFFSVGLLRLQRPAGGAGADAHAHLAAAQPARQEPRHLPRGAAALPGGHQRGGRGRHLRGLRAARDEPRL